MCHKVIALLLLHPVARRYQLPAHSRNNEYEKHAAVEYCTVPNPGSSPHASADGRRTRRTRGRAATAEVGRLAPGPPQMLR